MRLLPALSTPAGEVRLPASDRSAALLAELLLADDPAELTETLSEQLAEDPPLVLWVALRAGEDARWRPRSLTDVAVWLAHHAMAVLQWPANVPDDESGLDEYDLQRYGDRVAADLLLADTAALLAEEVEGADVEEVYLLGLLQGATAWLETAGLPPEQATALGQSNWWAKPSPPAAECLGQAARPLARPGDAPQLATAAIEAAHQRVAERRDSWLEVLPGAATVLPRIARRMARLDALEKRFSEVLEQEKLDAMAEFAAGAGHEINNPLAVIGGRAQYFLKEETDPERRRGLALMNAQVKRAYEMIADMRLFARPPEPDPQPLNLTALLDSVVAEMAPEAARYGIAIVRTGQADPLTITADVTQLNVAVRALIRNAEEAIGHEGRIELSASGTADAITIRIADDGPGITSEQRKHLFDPFYSARQAGRGLGLGLSKVWRIVVTNHRGRIDVASEPGRGATFSIRLPRRG